MATPLDISKADLLTDGAPLVQVLSNGRYTTVVTAAGTGSSSHDSLALTRWVPDRTQDNYGWFVYLRDESSGVSWSAGLQPVHHAPFEYTARFTSGSAQLRRVDGEIETIVDVCVAPDADVELRRVSVTNHGSEVRHLSLTTYAEAVLNAAAADAGHPAFSKLFVQTERTSDGHGLIARRRLRSPDEQAVCVMHRFWAVDSSNDVCELESDRARFIGRGRSVASPRAMDATVSLSGTVGNVLDPVLSIRRYVTIAPGSTVRFVGVLAAAETRSDLERITAPFAGETSPASALRAVAAAFDGARARAIAVLEESGMDELPARDLAHALGVTLYGSGGRLPFTAERGVVVDDRLLLGMAREVMESGGGARDTNRIVHFTHGFASHMSHAKRQSESRISDMAASGEERLTFFNGYGGFSSDGTEYVIRPEPTANGYRWPPQPWTNVIANERVGFIASERGAGYTWSMNSRTNRLTPWSNDPVCDPHGEALYVRDDATGVFWSPTPGPAVGSGRYEIRHGFGYTTYTHASDGLREDVTAFVARGDPVKITRVRVVNNGPIPRRISLFSYAQWVLGGVPWENAPTTITSARDDVITAVNPASDDFASLIAFAAVIPAIDGNATVSLTADRSAFLGRFGDAANPAALHSDAALDGRAGGGLDPCAAFRVSLVIPPGAATECVVLLGQGSDTAEVASIIARYHESGAVDAALDDARAFWHGLLAGVQIETPLLALDLMLNGWLAYQNLSCRIWGRSAFYQSGGAFGFRDQLQDAMALVYLAPARTRAQILLHAAHQFVEGDVLHWWHPPAGTGIRTRFSDDLIWLPYATAFYVETTGDESVLDESVRFIIGPELQQGEDELLVHPVIAEETASVYEHCCRALDRSLAVGAHGLPLMGTGDWNDGMNRVGRLGRGESVWLGFFLSHVVEHFVPFCEMRGDTVRAARYRTYLADVRVALNDAGWDGEWYRRAYYDDGTPLGSASSDEGRIDAIAQAWSVIAGVAPPDRARRALDALDAHLVSEQEGIIRLLAPAFDRTPHDPGYIKGYLPGVRENGGQYTHGALWAVKAFAELGRAERAVRLLEMVSPVSHGRTSAEIAMYQVEPYVIAADVYGVAPHVGRGGWTWYTGSAGWMFRVALESILGVELRGGSELILRPSVPLDWPEYRVRYRLPDRSTTYELIVRHAEHGAITTIEPERTDDVATVRDGAVVIHLRADGTMHRMHIALGDDLTPRYAAGAGVARVSA